MPTLRKHCTTQPAQITAPHTNWDATPHSTCNTSSTVPFQSYRASARSVGGRGALSIAILPPYSLWVWDQEHERTHGRTLHLPTTFLWAQTSVFPWFQPSPYLWVTFKLAQNWSRTLRPCHVTSGPRAYAGWRSKQYTAWFITAMPSDHNSLDDSACPGPASVFCLGRLVGITWGPLLIRKKKTLCLVFVFSFTSCYNSNALPQFWNAAIQQFECLIVTKIS